MSIIACDLSGKDRGERQELLASLIGRASDERELSDGYAFAFPAGEATLVKRVC